MNGFLKKIGETIILVWVLVFMFSHFSLLIILVCLFLNNCGVYLLFITSFIFAVLSPWNACMNFIQHMMIPV